MAGVKFSKSGPEGQRMLVSRTAFNRNPWLFLLRVSYMDDDKFAEYQRLHKQWKTSKKKVDKEACKEWGAQYAKNSEDAMMGKVDYGEFDKKMKEWQQTA